MLAPQARRLKGSQALVFDSEHVHESNADARAADRFVDELVAEGVVDERRVYAMGASRGGEMAALYAALRPDRVAAFAAFGADASHVRWSCEGGPPPAALVYRACDSVVPCRDVESWLEQLRASGGATFALRLGSAHKPETHCAVGDCSERLGRSNHARWPAANEEELLTFLGRFSLLRP